MSTHQTTSSPKVILNSPESWEFTRQVMLVIGKIPSSFTSSIRTLRANAEENRKTGNDAYTQGSRFVASRILKGPSMMAPFYFYLRTYHEEAIENSKEVNVDRMIKMVSPDEAAAIIAAVYLTRRVKKLVPDEDWGAVVEPMLAECEIGAHVGMAIRRVGPGDGLLMGVGRYCGRLILAQSNPRSTKEYRRHLKASKLPYDLLKETELYGCTHLQVASMIFQVMGFGIKYAHSFTNGLSAQSVTTLESDPDAERLKTVDIWVQELLKSGSEPVMNHKANLYPNKSELDLLLANAKGYIEEKSPFRWLVRTKDEITPDSAPQLIHTEPVKGEESAPPPEVPPEPSVLNPQGTEEQISEAELKEIAEE